ncbi:MAG TPA: lysozyme inhibitor LprI family protein [Allosphingosinicella sp.]|nr:lysozyme inhibitor LprI family protein [Allosphingosinicella sp.]
MMPLIALALLSLQQAPEPEVNCEDPQNQMEMNMCAGQDFERADVELNRLWPGLIADAREADREVDRSYDTRPGYEATLREAQRAWIAFRDSHCTWQAYQARGGSMESMLYGGCRATLTRERIRQLTEPGLGG